MSQFRLPLVVMLLVLAGCTGRGSAPGGDAVATYAETDFATAPDRVYTEAAGRISRAIGRELSDLPGARAYGPKDVVGVGQRHLVVAMEPGEDGELLVLSLVGDATLWTEAIPLASGTLLGGSELVEHAGRPLLRLDLDEAGGIDALYLHPAATGPVVARAEAAGQVANAALRRAHPAVPTMPGDLGSPDPVAQLAATVHLAGPDMAAARGRNVTVGHLQALAGSTDTWLASAAAALLTMPTE